VVCLGSRPGGSSQVLLLPDVGDWSVETVIQVEEGSQEVAPGN
jgi:hypothetical protein